MNDLENYKDLVDKIFGDGAATFNMNSTKTNHIVQALNSTDNFFDFQRNFESRLVRLNYIYSSNNINRQKLIDQVNQIASSKNWEGAFAELTAYDCLNQELTKGQVYLLNQIEIDKTIENHKTFAYELGKKEANLDGYYDEFDVYFDVKCFKDNVKEILERIFELIKKEVALNFHIDASYTRDIPYKIFQNSRTSLHNELKNKINEGVSYIKSDVIQGLEYRLLWDKGVMTTFGSYNAFRHAEKYHRTIFNYADKFVKSSPSFIVLVIFPWFNNLVLNFSSNNKHFYRSISRRVFCQYKNLNDPFTNVLNNFNGDASIYEVSRKISGLIFIEDSTINSRDSDAINASPFIYMNPNADNKVQNRIFEETLKNLNYRVFEDFKYDNY